MADRIELSTVDIFTAGALGQPGARVFYLQARHETHHVTFKCEKQHVSALAEYLASSLADLPQPEAVATGDALELSEPVLPLYVVGPIGVGFDASADRFVIGIEEQVDTDDEGEPVDLEAYEQRGTARVLITRDQAAAFIVRAESLMSAGRPRCRFCGQPMDPKGHPCPRMN